jgi:hypothetical protein
VQSGGIAAHRFDELEFSQQISVALPPSVSVVYWTLSDGVIALKLLPSIGHDSARLLSKVFSGTGSDNRSTFLFIRSIEMQEVTTRQSSGERARFTRKLYFDGDTFLLFLTKQPELESR